MGDDQCITSNIAPHFEKKLVAIGVGPYPNFDDAVERARCLANKHVDRYNSTKDNNIEGTTTISDDDDDERPFGPSRLTFGDG